MDEKRYEMYEQLRREIEELKVDLPEVEGSLAEQLADLKRSSRHGMDLHGELIAWLLRATTKLLEMNLLVDPNTGHDLRPKMKQELTEILAPRKDP